MSENNSSSLQQAQVVLIGRGVIGCSFAYHLADMGLTNVVLIECDQLASGTTWHAPGLPVLLCGG
jgi:glycine/D-amino acid oxidase-like deaminating enzyme